MLCKKRTLTYKIVQFFNELMKSVPPYSYQMQLYYHHPNPVVSIAELTDGDFLITQPQDVLDIFGDLMAQDCDRIISTNEAFMQVFLI